MTAMSEPTSPSKNLVGPVIQAGEIADAVVAAVQEDNAGKEVPVADRGSYVRIEVDTECIIAAGDHRGRARAPVPHARARS